MMYICTTGVDEARGRDGRLARHRPRAGGARQWAARYGTCRVRLRMGSVSSYATRANSPAYGTSHTRYSGENGAEVCVFKPACIVSC